MLSLPSLAALLLSATTTAASGTQQRRRVNWFVPTGGIAPSLDRLNNTAVRAAA